MSDSAGKVYLIGAGPGDPGLFTLRGAECLRAADVILYDYLASPELLALSRPTPSEFASDVTGKGGYCRRPRLTRR